MTRLSDAVRSFAEERHAGAGQLYGDLPYTHHLDAVAGQLERFGFVSLTYQATGYLHDTIEDTDTSYEELEKRFGPLVAQMVWAVTGVGATRAERNEDIYRKLAACPAACPVKAADRLANHTACLKDPTTGKPNLPQIAKYFSERDGFLKAVAANIPHRMLEALQGQYRAMAKILSSNTTQMESIND